MKTREVPQNEWPTFADAFSRQHQGWLTTLEIDREPTGEQGAAGPKADSRKVLARDLPLAGVSVEPQGERTLWWISVGDEHERIIHRVPDATRVRFQSAEDGFHAGAEINTASGETTYLRFRSAARPEELDGLG